MYDIIVLGGGHAGVEAALAGARLGNRTLMVFGNYSRIAHLSCNPSIGGPAKGIIVREIDALGGQMAKAIDRTLLQIKMLNISKGPAVQALRAQADKIAYPEFMKDVIKNTPGLEYLEAYIVDLIVESGIVKGVVLENGKKYFSKAVIISSGTYLSSRILVGQTVREAGPDDERTTKQLSGTLRQLGFTILRLKTGTPPRIKRSSIDFSKMKPQEGDSVFRCFSHETQEMLPYEKQEKCYLTYTTEETHRIIKENLHLSSMYSGLVEGVGPRYCPSIEDKVVRFADKSRHQVFLEPESLFLDEMYVQGLSTSLPVELQETIVRSVPGLENAVISRYAYAIEYDAIDPRQLKTSLESKLVKNLFFAGQVNGTSGYEEAACQGLIAGINANQIIKNKPPLVLRRDEAYIGVLIDDLITKGVKDPYRLLTSRAEFRLLLRHDNAETRLIKYGYKIGLISQARYQGYLKKREMIDNLIEKTREIKVRPKPETNEYLELNKKMPLNKQITGFDFLKRPDIDFLNLEEILGIKFNLSADIKEHALIEIKYSGYIEKEYKEAKKLARMESRKIPIDIDYDAIPNIAYEARDKLKSVRPETISQASRISGVNPSDVAILLVWLEYKK
ncbi:MAG: tRNA uridine-5-carboxymethylaminomethyl(34) synthesis enzyme MnmG [Bacilli bacterium]|nr:tRNA uridine-5-carboxymethylaminomethyl(34) synthesis enzyme MnmG [Bacilli bacterium]MDD4076611.1 tRNA uridine-5-carboxymethylaminomethyl(34) synthesis enzyme MnmG [Bacilli bacterium]MDD4387931.1 tRNA uridine-5-carboxymethylaminomethyl(34) synthesis enzyme MnmG [Bacilli bacterium]